MLETPEETDRLPELPGRSAAAAGPHLRGIITDERRLSAARVCQLLQGARIAAEKMFTFAGGGLSP